MCKEVGGEFGFCVDVVKKCSVDIEEEIIEENCEEEIMIGKIGVECFFGLYIGGKKC